MRRAIPITACAAALAVVTMMAAVAPSSAARYRRRDKVIAPGVVLTRIQDPKGPWSIRAISVELGAASTIEPVLATGKLPGLERTSAMAARYGALAAINGDYFRASGRPVMLFAQDGELAQTALTWGVNFAVDQSETTSFIGHVDPQLWLAEQDTGVSHVVNRFNAGEPGWKQIAGFSMLGGSDEKPPEGACSARLYPIESWRSAGARIGTAQSHVVNKVGCKSTRMYPKRGRIFSAPFGAAKATAVTSLVPGQEVEFGWALGNQKTGEVWPGVFETIGGNPTIVSDGQIVNVDGDTPFHKRNPRTGVGYTDDGRVLFVTVDGRQRGYSVGMTLKRFAKLFVGLGATRALNLDGGGSTTMVVNNEIVNRPSDGRERPVGSALLLLPGPDPVPVATPLPPPTPSPSPTATSTPTPGASPSQLLPDVSPIERGSVLALETWTDAASDPGSIGGLADWLRSEGFRLRGSLRRAFLLFSDAR